MDQQVQMVLCYKAQNPVYLDVATREGNENDLWVEQLYFDYSR